MDATKPDLSFVLPAHNEARNVAGMAERLAQIARPLGSFEIIFVDDGSTDATLAEIRGAGRRSMRACATSPSAAISAIRPRCAPGCAMPEARPWW